MGFLDKREEIDVFVVDILLWIIGFSCVVVENLILSAIVLYIEHRDIALKIWYTSAVTDTT